MQVDMYKAMASWGTLAKDTFVSMIHLLLYTKQIGSISTLETYMHCVDSLFRNYVASTDSVRVIHAGATVHV